MDKMERMFDIAIIGAGPAGISTAISLMRNKQQPLRVALIDKALFPRDKVCGDAIPFWVFNELEEICPDILQKMQNHFHPQLFRSTRLYTAPSRSVSVTWSQPGFMIPRMDLDHFLLDQIRDCGETRIIEGFPVRNISRSGGWFHLESDAAQPPLQARFVVGADGAPSTVSRYLLKDFAKCYRSGSAVRTYLHGLTIADPETAMVFYDRRFAPGYFWVFPIGPDRANAGFGMTNRDRQRKRINLKEAFSFFIHRYGDLFGWPADREHDFALRGGFLPFSNGVGRMTRPGFALTGDAAYLNDPLSGDGIRNAVISGILAGKALARISDPKTLHDLELEAYQQNLSKRLHRELKYRALTVRIVSRLPFLVELGIRLGNQSWILRKVKKWI